MNLRIFAMMTGALLLTSLRAEPARGATSDTAGTIIATGPMTVARFDHAAVLLPTGRVLIVGGIERNGVMQPGAELFDPAAGRFTATGTPITAHGWGVTATVLRNGKVLVAGGSTGCDSPCFTASAELYDPATGTFAPTGKMTVPRAEARACFSEPETCCWSEENRLPIALQNCLRSFIALQPAHSFRWAKPICPTQRK